MQLSQRVKIRSQRQKWAIPWRGPHKGRASSGGFPANAPSKPESNDLEDDVRPEEPLRARQGQPRNMFTGVKPARSQESSMMCTIAAENLTFLPSRSGDGTLSRSFTASDSFSPHCQTLAHK